MKAASFDRLPKQLRDRRLVILIRSAERVDRVFPEWLNANFTDAGEYAPNDLNLPLELLQRPGGIGDYVDDPPITEMGRLMSEVIGRGFRQNDLLPIAAVYCSPALRCVQTAAAVIRGTGLKLALRIEPTFFDYAGMYHRPPAFVSVVDLKKSGVSVDASYVPLLRTDRIDELIPGHESTDDFYHRVQRALPSLLETLTCGNVIIVTHATTLLAGIHALRHTPFPPKAESALEHTGYRIPYNCVVCLAEEHNLKASVPCSFIRGPLPEFSYLGMNNAIDGKWITKNLKAACESGGVKRSS